MYRTARGTEIGSTNSYTLRVEKKNERNFRFFVPDHRIHMFVYRVFRANRHCLPRLPRTHLLNEDRRARQQPHRSGLERDEKTRKEIRTKSKCTLRGCWIRVVFRSSLEFERILPTSKRRIFSRASRSDFVRYLSGDKDVTVI